MSTKRRGMLAILGAGLLATLSAHAAIQTFDSDQPANNATYRNNWLAAVGISAPAVVVDFESGFSNGQNVHNVSGLFPAGLIIRAVGNSQAIVSSGTIDGSNPVGTFALKLSDVSTLVLDFSASPIDYLGFLDIDHIAVSNVGTNDFASVTLVGGEKVKITLDTTASSGDSAESYGVFRNDSPQITHLELNVGGDGYWAIDNIEYGIVPLPMTAWLLASAMAFAGLGFNRRRAH